MHAGAGKILWDMLQLVYINNALQLLQQQNNVYSDTAGDIILGFVHTVTQHSLRLHTTSIHAYILHNNAT